MEVPLTQAEVRAVAKLDSGDAVTDRERVLIRSAFKRLAAAAHDAILEEEPVVKALRSRAHRPPHAYPTEEQRLEARRRSWRESKRRTRYTRRRIESARAALEAAAA